MAKIASKKMLDDSVRFEFINGEMLDCALVDIPQEIVHKLALHGLSQKVGDSYAGAESVETAKANATAVWNNLTSGLWAAKVSRGSKLAEALHRITGQPLDVCIAKVAQLSDDQKKQLNKRSDVKKVYADMAAEAAEKQAAMAGDDEQSLTDLF